jgi:uncharacterized membrane protein
VVAALAVGAALRLAKLPATSLNYDGLQSVTHAVRGVPVGVFSAFFHDPHPPAYYVMLGGWMTLGTSDAVVLLLSALLSLALVPSAWWIGRAHFGERAGVVAALACAVHPLALYWSHYARMYALLMLLALWAWHFNRRLLTGERFRWAAAAGASITQLGLVYSHVAGLFMVACVSLTAALERRPGHDARRHWIYFQVPVGLASLPALWFAMRERPGHTRVPDAAEIWQTLSVYVNGVDEPTAFWVAAGATGFLLLVGALLAQRGTRGFAVGLLILPFAVAGLVSHVGRPIWYGPRLFAFVMPFVALALGRLAAEGSTPPRQIGRAVAVLVLALMLRGAVAYTWQFEKPQRFVDAAARLREHAQPGDRVLVPSLRDEWGLVWYLSGPDWARGVWTGTRAEALRDALDGARRPDFVHHLVTWGEAAGPEEPGVIPAHTADRSALDGVTRVWLLTRYEGQRDPLLARFDLGPEIERYEPLGLQLSLHEKP